LLRKKWLEQLINRKSRIDSDNCGLFSILYFQPLVFAGGFDVRFVSHAVYSQFSVLAVVCGLAFRLFEVVLVSVVSWLVFFLAKSA
jgi:hypothetical protein